MRVRVPHDREDKRLRFHGLRAQVKRHEQHTNEQSGYRSANMAKAKRQIIAIGGGGFASQPENPALELYLLAQARRRNPSVCFVGTASGDAPTYVAKFYAAFAKLRCRPTHLPLFERTPKLEETILAQDVIYVGGGNTKSMLGVWREWQLPKLLRAAWNQGTVLAGISAGAICWFERK